MNLLDALRHAEQQGKETMHRGAQKIHEIEAAIRRQAKGQTTIATDPEQESAPPSKARTGIVSVNGRDVGHMRCTGGRRSA